MGLQRTSQPIMAISAVAYSASRGQEATSVRDDGGLGLVMAVRNEQTEGLESDKSSYLSPRAAFGHVESA